MGDGIIIVMSVSIDSFMLPAEVLQQPSCIVNVTLATVEGEPVKAPTPEFCLHKGQ